MNTKKPKQEPGMADAENVFAELEAQERETRRREWLEEHKKDSKPKGGDEESLHQG